MPDRATEYHSDYAADSLKVLSVAEASVEWMWEGCCIFEEHIQHFHSKFPCHVCHEQSTGMSPSASAISSRLKVLRALNNLLLFCSVAFESHTLVTELAAARFSVSADHEKLSGKTSFAFLAWVLIRC